MAHVMQLNDGTVHIVLDDKDFMKLIEEHMGIEARDWLEEWISDMSCHIGELEDELVGGKEHHREVMEDLLDLIKENSIDWKEIKRLIRRELG